MSDDLNGRESGNHDDGGESFLDSISDETLRGEPSLQDIKSLDDLAKGYVHAQRMVGRDKLPLPSSEDDEDGWNEVYKRLGRPETAADYELGELPTMDNDGYEVPEDYIEGLRETAYKAGITKAQMKALYEFDSNYAKDKFAEGEMAFERAAQQTERTLRREYGKTYDHKVDLANRVLGQFGSDELIDRMDKVGLTNDPDMVRLMVAIGEKIGEDTLPSGESSGGFGMTPDQAKAEIGKLKLNDSFMSAYQDRYHTGHDEAVKRMQELFEYAYPETAEG